MNNYMLVKEQTIKIYDVAFLGSKNKIKKTVKEVITQKKKTPQNESKKKREVITIFAA